MMHTALLPALVGLALLLGACCGEAEPPAPTHAELDATWRGEGDTIVVKVDDLHCPKCEASVKREFSAVEGVVSVEPDHVSDLVRVRIADASARYDLIPQLDAALAKVGKRAVTVAQSPAE